MKIEMVIVAVLAVANLVSFCMMGYDKWCARRGKWRVPERRLFLAAACFGALGGVLGMQMFRHKTKHLSFKIFFPAMLVLQVGILAAILWMW